jgi:hypothetical protein
VTITRTTVIVQMAEDDHNFDVPAQSLVGLADGALPVDVEADACHQALR